MSIWICLDMPCSYWIIAVIIAVEIFYFKNYALNRFALHSKFFNIKTACLIKFRHIFKCYFKGLFCISWHCYTDGFCWVILIMTLWRRFFCNIIRSDYLVYLPIPWTCYMSFFVCSWVNPSLSTVIRKCKRSRISWCICCDCTHVTITAWCYPKYCTFKCIAVQFHHVIRGLWCFDNI